MKKIIMKAAPITILGVLLVMSPLTVNSISNYQNICENCNNMEAMEAIEEVRDIDTVTNYYSFKGKVQELDVEDYGVSMLVHNDNENPIEGMIFNVNEKTLLFSSSTKENISIEDLNVNSNVTAYYHKNTPMLMSLPGQLSPDILVVNDSEEIFTKLDDFNFDFLSFDGNLKLNISNKTEIIGLDRSKVELNSLKDNNTFLVFYSNSTKSIPAQTNPEKVILIKDAFTQKFNDVKNYLFNDIDENHWAKDEIEEFYNKKLINGYEDGNFRPSNQVTRREFMTMLGRIMNEVSVNPVKINETELKLLNEDEWGFEEINQVLRRLGIGTASKLKYETIEDLNEFITRKEVACLIDSVIELSNESQEAKEVKFVDVNDRNEYKNFEYISYTNNILNLAEKGIIVGFEDNTFRPDNPLTRAEAVVILSRLLK